MITVGDELTGCLSKVVAEVFDLLEYVSRKVGQGVYSFISCRTIDYV